MTDSEPFVVSSCGLLEPHDRHSWSILGGPVRVCNGVHPEEQQWVETERTETRRTERRPVEEQPTEEQPAAQIVKLTGRHARPVEVTGTGYTRSNAEPIAWPTWEAERKRTRAPAPPPPDPPPDPPTPPRGIPPVKTRLRHRHPIPRWRQIRRWQRRRAGRRMDLEIVDAGARRKEEAHARA